MIWLAEMMLQITKWTLKSINQSTWSSWGGDSSLYTDNTTIIWTLNKIRHAHAKSPNPLLSLSLNLIPNLSPYLTNFKQSPTCKRWFLKGEKPSFHDLSVSEMRRTSTRRVKILEKRCEVSVRHHWSVPTVSTAHCVVGQSKYFANVHVRGTVETVALSWNYHQRWIKSQRIQTRPYKFLSPIPHLDFVTFCRKILPCRN